MAVVGNSYLYHMRKVSTQILLIPRSYLCVDPGSCRKNSTWCGPSMCRFRAFKVSFINVFLFNQHMGENVLALIRHLTSSDSPLPSLTTGYTTPTTVFFNHIFQTFFTYSYATAKVIYTALFLSSFLLVWVTFVDPAPALKKAGCGFWREQIRGCFAVTAGMLGALLIPNVIAFIMKNVLDKAMSWFTSPLAAIAFYGPAGLLGMSSMSLFWLTLLMNDNRSFTLPISCWRRSRTIGVFCITAHSIVSCVGSSNGWYRISSNFLPGCIAYFHFFAAEFSLC